MLLHAKLALGAGALLVSGIAAAVSHHSAPTPYQRCVAEVNVFLTSPVGQLDADVLGGPAAYTSYLLGECQAKYGP